jgi:HTH DNA binding domain/Protein of unknown function (DUF1612)
MTQTHLKSSVFSDADISADEAVFAALARAEDRVSRLDERARASGFIEGWRARADIRAVIAAMAIDGQLVHPEDLILRDVNADTRLPDPSVTRASATLRGRQRANQGGEELLGWQGISWICGLTRQAPPPGPRPSARVVAQAGEGGALAALGAFFHGLAKHDTEAPRAGVEDCLGILDLDVPLPPLLQAAAFLEAWRIADPLPGHRAAGAIAAALILKSSRRFTSALFPVDVGARRRIMAPRLAWAPLSERLAYWLGVIELAAELELEEITRLGHQKALLERRAAGGRRHSKAPAFAALAIEYPVLTTELIVRSLGVTPQGGLQLVKRFGGALREITGRSRYRVWRL